MIVSLLSDGVRITGKIIDLLSGESDELLFNTASLLLPHCELDVELFFDTSMLMKFRTTSGDGVISFNSGSEGTGSEGSSGVLRSAFFVIQPIFCRISLKQGNWYKSRLGELSDT